ncbi:MAG: efflux RND transporter periplasmic adaptor subunit [Clostridiales bacterium]|jgi:RND family efflux transporter MFP subunit|nr:efflux RND transporter periplasmic adaptor subunit [Clostridiales bacterium]
MKIPETARRAVRCALPIFLLCACSAPKAAEEAPLVPVEVTIAAPTGIKNELSYVGEVKPARSVNVIAKVPGKVTNTYFETGDAVSAEDVLFTVDTTDVENSIRQIDAQIAQADKGISTAENALASTQGGQYQSSVLSQETGISNTQAQLSAAEITVKNAEISVQNAQAQFENVSSSFDATKTLYDNGLVAKNDYDKAQLGYDQAQSTLDSARNARDQAEASYNALVNAAQNAQKGLELTQTTIAEDNRRQAQLALDSARASKDVLLVQKSIAEKSLSDTKVTSPISGVVSAKNADVNGYVSAGSPAYVIVDLRGLSATVNVSSLLVGSLKHGDPVSVSARGGSSETQYAGSIKTIAPSADQTGTYPVEVSLPGASDGLKPGMFVSLRFTREKNDSAIAITPNAVLSDDKGYYVYLEKNGVVERTPVTLGINGGALVEIASGVSSGDRVITKGQTYVSSGDHVNVSATVDASAPQTESTGG